MLDSYDPRWGDESRDRDGESRDLGRAGTDPREREQVDPRDVFMDHVDLPRGFDREHVHTRDHDYTLRGSETRTLATVGAFRVVPANDLRDKFDESLDPRQGELWHLRDSGLVHTVQLDRGTTVVTLAPLATLAAHAALTRPARSQNPQLSERRRRLKPR
jgi:hypothetical protein